MVNKQTMRIDIDYNSKELKKASANYLKDIECFEVELIRNPSGYMSGHDTKYRIEFIDNDYIDITISELKALKQLLNNDMITKLLELDKIGD